MILTSTLRSRLQSAPKSAVESQRRFSPECVVDHWNDHSLDCLSFVNPALLKKSLFQYLACPNNTPYQSNWDSVTRHVATPVPFVWWRETILRRRQRINASSTLVTIIDLEDRVKAFGTRQFVQKKTDNSGQTEDLSRPLKNMYFSEYHHVWTKTNEIRYPVENFKKSD